MRESRGRDTCGIVLFSELTGFIILISFSLWPPVLSLAVVALAKSAGRHMCTRPESSGILRGRVWIFYRRQRRRALIPAESAGNSPDNFTEGNEDSSGFGRRASRR